MMGVGQVRLGCDGGVEDFARFAGPAQHAQHMAMAQRRIQVFGINRSGRGDSEFRLC